jgi:hypothetical protein
VKGMKLQHNTNIQNMMKQDPLMFSKENCQSESHVIVIKEACEVIRSRDTEVRPLNINQTVMQSPQNLQ